MTKSTSGCCGCPAQCTKKHPRFGRCRAREEFEQAHDDTPKRKSFAEHMREKMTPEERAAIREKTRRRTQLNAQKRKTRGLGRVMSR